MTRKGSIPMPKHTVFLRNHALPAAVELEFDETATVADLIAAFERSGVVMDVDTSIFVDEADAPHDASPDATIAGLRRGSHVHATKCKKIDVAINFAGETANHRFAPGARVRRVKAWAVDKFGLTPHDAAEHVLQMCGTTRRPSSDTPLDELTDGRTCSVCFDLVPEKRVEG